MNFETRGNNTLDLVYTMEKNAYKSVLSSFPGYDHISVMLIPAYRPLLKLVQNRSQYGQMLPSQHSRTAFSIQTGTCSEMQPPTTITQFNFNFSFN